MREVDTLSSQCVQEYIAGRGYVYVSLFSPLRAKNRFIKMHKIVALCMINNGPYILIEHINDNKLDNSPENLKFSDKRSNSISMYKNGISNHDESVFEVKMMDGALYVGTMKEISSKSGIPRGTLYDRFYKGIGPDTSRTKHRFKYIKEIYKGKQRFA